MEGAVRDRCGRAEMAVGAARELTAQVIVPGAPSTGVVGLLAERRPVSQVHARH